MKKLMSTGRFALRRRAMQWVVVALGCGLCFIANPVRAGLVSGTFFPLTEGTTVDLTAEGELDWIKFGNGEHETTEFFVTTKIGNPVFLPATLAPLGTPPQGFDVELRAFSGGEVLFFTWTNGNFGMHDDLPVDTVVTESLTPPATSYPIGLGSTFDALASSSPRIMNVYVQGFNADMLITASMSGGGSDSVVVSPSFNPSTDPTNDYSAGYYQVVYSGAGETLTVSVVTQDPRTDGASQVFANAGFFAASVVEVPEPSSLALAAMACLAMLWSWRRRK